MTTRPVLPPEGREPHEHHFHDHAENAPLPKVSDKWRLVVYSAIGAFVFFFPITYNGKQSIPLDHMVTMIQEYIPAVVPWIILVLAGYGTWHSIANKNWEQGAFNEEQSRRLRRPCQLPHRLGCAPACQVTDSRHDAARLRPLHPPAAGTGPQTFRRRARREGAPRHADDAQHLPR